MDPETLTPAAYQALVAKGKTIYEDAIRKIGNDGDKLKALPEIAPNYKATLDLHTSAFIADRCESSLLKLGHPVYDYYLALIDNTVQYSTQPQQEPPYQNYFHADGKTMLCMNNFAERDQLFGKTNRIFWSDLMAVCFSRAMMVSHGNTNCLEAIWRLVITNRDTHAVLDILYDNIDGKEFRAEEDGFFAFAGYRSW
ncbi:hypothetical protein ACHAQJ_007564 [Trichoderma viride]